MLYPITIVFPNDNTIEVGSRNQLKIAVRKWKNEHPNAEERPSISYPIEVMFEDQDILTVDSAEELKQLKKDCRE